MKTSKLSFIARLFACCMFLCCGIAGAQSPDRILAFDSRITLDRDRTLNVAEAFEIVNDNGVFDSGFHRRLWIKPVNTSREASAAGRLRPKRIWLDQMKAPACADLQARSLKICGLAAEA